MSRIIIFFGSQGSGKGTQSKMCASFLEDRGESTIRIATGEGFRKLAEHGGLTGERVRSELERGEMLPVFFPVWLWTRELLENYTGKENIVIDGSPRTVEELEVFNAAVDFYGWNPIVLSLSLSEDEVYTRIRSRGRSDDSDDGLEKRLSWYRDHTLPVLNEMRKDTRYAIHDIDGARTVEEIFADIKSIVQE